MDAAPAKRKRGRLPAACSECVRRRQRCSGHRPCAMCSKRNVPDKCIYAFEDASATKPAAKNTAQQPAANECGVPCKQDEVRVRKEWPRVPRQVPSHLKPLQRHMYSYALGQLPSAPIIARLTDVYFAELDWHFDLLDRPFFVARWTRWLEPNSSPASDDDERECQYFPGLLLQMMAVTLMQLDPASDILELLGLETSQAGVELAETWSDAGNSLVDAMGRVNTCITAIQCDFLRCWWVKTVARGKEAVRSFQNALMQAHELDMHKTTAISLESVQTTRDEAAFWHEQRRRRLWALLFCSDAFSHMILARPRLINMDDCDLTPPATCEFGPEQSTPARSNMFQLVVYTISQQIHDLPANPMTVPIATSPTHPAHLHAAATNLFDCLPSSLNPKSACLHPILAKQRLQAQTIVYQYLLFLHTKYMHMHPPSRTMLLETGLACLSIQQRFFELHSPHEYRVLGLVYNTVHAAGRCADLAEMYPTWVAPQRTQVMHALDQAVARFTKMQSISMLSGPGLDMVHAIRGRIEGALDAAQTASDGSQEPSGGVVNGPSWEMALAELVEGDWIGGTTGY